jgi:hypothetical protein
MKIIVPILEEQWIVAGQRHASRPVDADALYITPLLSAAGLTSGGMKLIHSLVLDTNVLMDLVQERRPDANAYLIDLLRTHPIELNPAYAMMEQRQQYGGAAEVLPAFAEFARRNFGWGAAAIGAQTFEAALAQSKPELKQNMELLSGYVSAIVFLYHQKASAAEKLDWLSGLIRSADLPHLPVQFFYAAIAFLSAERPDLFDKRELKKIRKDLALGKTLDDQRHSLLNIANDLALPTASLFQTAGEGTFIFPYIATRDVLQQVLLSEIVCGRVEIMETGRPLPAWGTRPGRRLATHLGPVIDALMPARSGPSTREDVGVRRERLRAFSETYLQRCMDLPRAPK